MLVLFFADQMEVFQPMLHKNSESVKFEIAFFPLLLVLVIMSIQREVLHMFTHHYT